MCSTQALLLICVLIKHIVLYAWIVTVCKYCCCKPQSLFFFHPALCFKDPYILLWVHLVSYFFLLNSMNLTHSASLLPKVPPIPYHPRNTVKTTLTHRVSTCEEQKGAIHNSTETAYVHYNCPRQAKMPCHLTHTGP